ncbi:hypothetical protein [Massilia soli]|uniref:Transposase n=1 Tax=Massilia soli TaxID=2792854 RepID=A0ABS7SRD9_9BURK|nr:hypothetical protein [Massilia soli]MBZ2208505.1 hypothetical protein [Massilia soli]
MSAATSTAKGGAASQIRNLAGDVEMGCLRLRVLLDSVTKSIDETGGDFQERLDAIDCFSKCAKQILATVLGNSLAMDEVARQAGSKNALSKHLDLAESWEAVSEDRPPENLRVVIAWDDETGLPCTAFFDTEEGSWHAQSNAARFPDGAVTHYRHYIGPAGETSGAVS